MVYALTDPKKPVIGVIAGLDMIEELCDEANEICRKRESGI